ncbi:MAG: hypothetical protein PSX36_04290 [bacterium]|nr:hypothetical protein [bacterium]
MRFLTAYFILLLCPMLAQDTALAKNAFMGKDILQAFDFWNITHPGTRFHSSFKPYLSSTYTSARDSLVPFSIYSFQNIFLSKHLISGSTKPDYSVQLHPIIDAEPGYDLLKKRSLLSLIAGTHVKANINSNFTFAATIIGGTMGFPFFLDTSVKKQKIIPEFGQGYGNGKSAYSFFDVTGYLSYTTKNKIFNVQAGRDKHFIGDGYRSVLLSDYSPANPYLRCNVNVWRLQYSVWYSWMYDVSTANGVKQNFTNKYGTFHYLSYNVVKEFSIGLFENVIWRGTDSNQVRTFEVNYLNPLIFLRPQEYSVGSPDNSFIGFNFNATLFKKLKIYGQLGLDEFYTKEVKAGNGWWGNKQAWQLGAKYVNALGIKGLKLQLEYNEARPYTYSHGLPDQNYAHYGTPLAHPFGANFKEIQGFVTYRHHRWELGTQLMYALIGKDSSANSSNVGQNIFLSYNTRANEYGNYTTQGLKTTVVQSHLKFTYFLIPNLNMRLELGYIQRSEKNGRGYGLENPYIYLGIKTSFWNTYRDF